MQKNYKNMANFKIKNLKISRYIAVAGLLVFLSAIGVLGPLEGLLTRLINPLFSSAQNLSSSITGKYQEQKSKVDFAQTIEEQRSELNRLLSENAELKVIREENELMRNFLNFFSENKFNRVMAEVVSRGDTKDLAGRIEVLSIDRGSRHGIYPGLVAINHEGIVIGKVSQVKDSISSIDLVVNDECRLAASILGEDNTSGIVEGDLGLTMKMNFIPQSKTISNNDVVVTSGLEEAIPRGLVIGVVSELKKESNELWQEAILESTIELDEITMVSIIIP